MLRIIKSSFPVLIFVLACVFFSCAAAQKLYYFKSKEGRMGVKDAAGKVIIPAEFLSFGGENGDRIKDQLIVLVSPDTNNDAQGYRTPLVMYNCKGEYLFQPYFFDNGADYISEGLFRIVKDQKIGFADRRGNIVIEPRFSFALPFLHGLSFYCNDCHFYTDSLQADDEHNLRLSASTWGIIGKDGKTLLAAAHAQIEKTDDGELADFMPAGLTEDRLNITDSLLAKLPPQFTYTQEEQKLLDKLRSSAYLGSMASDNVVGGSGTRATYEIVERPGPAFPYYWVKTYHIIDGSYVDAEDDFLMSANGMDIYRYQPLFDQKELLLPWKTKLRRK